MSSTKRVDGGQAQPLSMVSERGTDQAVADIQQVVGVVTPRWYGQSLIAAASSAAGHKGPVSQNSCR